MKLKLFFCMILGMQMKGIPSEQLITLLQKEKAPFSYDLGITVLSRSRASAPIMICCHGYGANNRIAQAVYSVGVVKNHLVSFNFPDYDLRNYDPERSTFGSIDELLPLFYVLKKCVIDAQQEKIDLYGFSAGGAAIINMLAVLNQGTYDRHLQKIGIEAAAGKKIRDAIQKGIVILECPLKSIEGIMFARGKSAEFEILAHRYHANGMRPLDSVQALQGLTLTILLYFEHPDDIIGNREDALFIERLKKANGGKTLIVTGSYGGHNAYHRVLWDRYKTL